MSFWDKAKELGKNALGYLASKLAPGKREAEQAAYLQERLDTTGKITGKDVFLSQPEAISLPVVSAVGNPLIKPALNFAAKEFVAKPFARAAQTITTSVTGRSVIPSPFTKAVFGSGIAGEQPGQVDPLISILRKTSEGQGFSGKISKFIESKTGLDTKYSALPIVAGLMIQDLFPDNPFKAAKALISTKGLNKLAAISDDAIDIASKLAKGEQISGVSSEILGKIKNVVDEMPAEEIAKLPSGEDISKIVGNINLSKFNLPKDSLDDMADMIVREGGFVEQRRGVQTWKDTQKLAAQILPNIKLKPGTALNADELLSLGNFTASMNAKISNLSEIIRSGKNDDLTLLELARAKEDYAFAFASLSGATAETGRSQNILKVIRNASLTQDLRLIKKALELSGGRETLEKLAATLAEFGDDTIAKHEFVQSLYKPKFKDYWGWYYYLNLLMGPLTQAKNFFGGLTQVGRKLAEKPVEVGIDLLSETIAKMTGKERGREVFLSEIPGQFVGAYAGMKDGFRKATHILANGYTFDDVVNSEFRKPEVFKGVLPNAVSRFMAASDAVFRSMGFQIEIYSSAISQAKKAGLKGKAFEQRVAELVSSPTQDMIELAAKAGAKTVFQEDPYKVVMMLEKWKQDSAWSPLINIILPFLRTPANIIKQGFELTPLGFVPKRGIKGRQLTQRQATAAFGSLVLTPLVFEAVEGNISGSGPSDPEEKARLYRTGWAPNSIKIGDTWVNYQSLGPLAIPLSVIGNAYEAYHYQGKEIDIASILARTTNSFLDNSFLSGLNSLSEALQDPENKGKRFVQNTMASITPGSQFFGQINRGLDRVVRRSDSALDTIKSKYPFLSEDLTPMRNVFGEIVVRPGGFFNQTANVLRQSFDTDQSTKVDAELHNAGIEITIPKRTVSIGGQNRKMNEEEYSEFLRVSGSIKLKVLDQVVDSEAWKTSTTTQKEKSVQKVMDAANEKGREVVEANIELRHLGLMPIEDQKINTIVYKIVNAEAYKKIPDDEIKKKLLIRLLGTLQQPESSEAQLPSVQQLQTSPK